MQNFLHRKPVSTTYYAWAGYFYYTLVYTFTRCVRVGVTTMSYYIYHPFVYERGDVVADTSRLPHPCTDVWDWQMQGSCRGMSSAVFFHPDGERGYARQAREDYAKSICAHCPVLEQCRTHALEAQEPYGIWGGMGEDERRQIITAARRRLHPS